MKNKFGFYSLLTSTVLLFLFFGMPYLLISLSLTGKIASLVTNIRYCLFCLLFASGFYWAIKSFVKKESLFMGFVAIAFLLCFLFLFGYFIIIGIAVQ